MTLQDIKKEIPKLTAKELSELKILIIAQQYSISQKSLKTANQGSSGNSLTIKW